MVMTKSIRGFFSNQRNVTLRLMIQSDKILNVQDFTHANFICKFQKHPIKFELVMLMAKSNRDISAIKGCNPKINDPIWPVLNFPKISSMSTLSASFRNIQSKLN